MSTKPDKEEKAINILKNELSHTQYEFLEYKQQKEKQVRIL